MTASRRPTRATVAGRAYLDLQNLARRQQRPTDELHQLYALEGFLARLTRSPQADRLVLKGGVLLAAYDARRPTRDVDIQARAIIGDRDDVLRLVRDIAAGALDDGLVFDTDAATVDIHPRRRRVLSGVRVTLTATLAQREAQPAHRRQHRRPDLASPTHRAPAQTARRDDHPGRLPAVHGVRGEDHHRTAARHRQLTSLARLRRPLTSDGATRPREPNCGAHLPRSSLFSSLPSRLSLSFLTFFFFFFFFFFLISCT